MFGECHAHIFMDGVSYKKAAAIHHNGVVDEVIRQHFAAYQKQAVTYIRDGGDCLGVSKRAAELAGEYGLTYRTPIFAIHKKGHYGSIVGRGFDSIEDYRALVGEVRRQGGHFIKIMITGIMDFWRTGSLTEAPLFAGEVREMIHIAHEEGFAVMAHANGAEAVRNAVVCGVDSIEHGNFIDTDCIDAMAAGDVVWVPTVVTVRNLLGEGRFSDQQLIPIWESQKKNLHYAYCQGVKLALGSDAGAYGVKHGEGIVDEYRAFQEILGKSEALDKRLEDGEQRIRKKF